MIQQKIKRSSLPIGLLLIIFLWSSLKIAQAAPPFITDDADPVPYGQLQTYLFASVTSSPHYTLFLAPAVEADLGLTKNLEFHVIVPFTTLIRYPGSDGAGIGDSLIGLKWRFLNETEYFPEIAIVPDFIIPTGDLDKDRLLSNGRSWSTLSMWLEKNIGPWTMYGGIGKGFNSAPDNQNYLYGGWLVQRTISEQLSLGAEAYAQGTTTTTHAAPFQDTGHFILINAGGNYNVTPSQGLLFSLGHSILGTPQWVGYLGWIWNIDFSKKN